MSRVTLHTLETAPQAAKPFLENAQKNSGFIPNLLGILAKAPAA